MFKSEVRDLRKNVYRTTSIMFVVQLFGALGAGFFFVIQNLFGVKHILGALEPQNESILWFILFWATDFFFVAMVVVLCYLIAGLPALAPALSLSIYFAHFAGTPVPAEQMYKAFFSSPLNFGGGVNIGYMGYLIMAVFMAYLIKYLFIGWNGVKEGLSKKLDKKLDELKAKNKKIPADLKSINILEQVDLIVLILLLPVVSCAITFLLIRYGVQIPFNALGNALIEPLTSLSGTSIVLCGLVMGLMVGFDIIGPVSMAAFSVAIAALAGGDARLMTIYGACFITTGWVPFMTFILNKITKKGGYFDTDDTNLSISGPINAFFENVKLTVSFSMLYAYRSPLTVIPGIMLGSGATGLMVALFKIINFSYINELPKYAGGATFSEIFAQNEFYISFTLPLRSGDFLSCRIPLFFIILFGALIGGAFILFARHIAYKHQVKSKTNIEPNGDIVIEFREYAKKLHKKYKQIKEAKQ
ncbi:MAG: hypothetical protein RRZ68_06915 [Oscillospiraceae bacterium]